MAEVNAKPKEKKENGVLSIFTKEYKFEGIILLILSLVALVLGTMVLIGIQTNGASGLVVSDGVFLIGDYPAAFAWILIVLGAVSLILAVWPFYKPSLSEIKKITWTKRGELLHNTAIVFAFILILSIFFIVCDFAFGYLVQFFQWIALKL